MEGIKRIWIIFIPILIVGGIFVLIRSGQGSKVDVSNVKGIETFTPTPTATNSTDMNNSSPSAVTSLKIEDELVGTGDVAVVGKTVTVNYLGTLISGVKFDSSYDRNQPFSFHLGAGEVIKGWDQGVAGMKVGGKRKLTIPSELGYGAAGAPPTIPGNATLIFEVELLKVE